MTSKPLVPKGIYNIALTAYQYVCEPVTHTKITHVLMPIPEGNDVLTGPVLAVYNDGTVTSDALSVRITVAELDFTGRVLQHDGTVRAYYNDNEQGPTEST